MIDLTLDSITIPNIDGYSPPFGTVKTYSQSNKGGLSTREVNNNIISYFQKMRPIVISQSESTSIIQYDARLVINAENQIQLSLSGASYKGCIITIINNTNIPHNLFISPSTYSILPENQLELVWNGTGWQNLKAPGVGKYIVQFPQEKEPAAIFPCTQWTEIDYNGSFFRTFKNGVSDPFIAQGTLTPQNFATAVGGLYFEGESKNTENETSHPTLGSITVKHYHTDTFVIAYKNGPDYSSSDYGLDVAQNNTPITVTKELTMSSSSAEYHFYEHSNKTHKHYFEPAGNINTSDVETRPLNLAVKIWKRIF